MTVLWAMLLACGGGSPGDTDTEEARVTVVETEAVHRGSVAERITTTAVVQAVRSADVTPTNPGLVKSVLADDGDAVERGQVLAVLENVALEANSGRSQAEVQRLEQQVRDMEALVNQGAVSKRDLDDLRFQLQSARRNAGEASRSFGQTRLTAPFSGVVARRDIKVGEIAQGRAFQIVDLGELEVKVDLPERDVSRVAQGQPVKLVSAYDVEVQGLGEVSRVAPVIDPTTGTFRVSVRVAQDQTLRPGQFVNTHIEVDRQLNVLVVPRNALLWEDGRPLVFVMGEPEVIDTDQPPPPPGAMMAKRTPVEVGLMDDVGVEIRNGLAEGDQVIVVGQATLKDGAYVRVPQGVKAVPVEEG